MQGDATCVLTGEATYDIVSQKGGYYNGGVKKRNRKGNRKTDG